MPSQKRKRNSEQDVSLHLSSDMRKKKKIRLNQNGFTDIDITTHESVTLPMCESDGTFDSKLIFQKFYRRKLLKDKKRKAGKTSTLYDSSGSEWNVIEKANVKSSSDEGMRKLYQKKKSEINRAVDVASLISVQSSEFNGIKEEIPHTFEGSFNNENEVLPKVKKKHRLKNKFIQPELCCTIQNDMPLVFERKKLKKHEVENIDNTIGGKQKEICGRITNEMHVKKNKQRGVELEKEKAAEGTKIIKKIKTLPNIENEDASDECEKNDVNIVKEHNVRLANEESDVRESERESGNVTEQKMSKKKKRISKRRSTENSLKTENVMMDCAGEIDKENEGSGVQQGEIKEKKLRREMEPSEKKRKILSLERGSELEMGFECEQVSEEIFVRSQNETLKKHVENEVPNTQVEEMFEDHEELVKDSGGKVKKKRKKELERLRNQGKQRPNSVNKVCDSFGEDDADICGNTNEQNNEDETIGRIKKKVTKLSIESDEEEDSEKVKGKASSEMVVNGDMSKYSCVEDDSEEEEEDNDFIVDDNYVSYEENATSDEEFEETECSSDDCSGSDHEDSSEVEEEEEEEQEHHLPERKKRMASQFFDWEAKDGKETDMEEEEEEEEETSSEEDSDGEDSVVRVEQFIDSEAREEITFVRRKKKVQVIESEEEEEKEEKKYPEAESLEKTMHIMKKLTRLMTVGVLKGKTTEKHKKIISKDMEGKEHDCEIRISTNESSDFTVRVVNEKKRTIHDEKIANQNIEELRIQQKMDEEIREILGEDKLGKKKRRKSATDWGRGYASEPEYVEAKKPRV